MILTDANVWLALLLSKHIFHRAARDWFDQQSTDGSVLFCRSTQQSFLRLLTTEATLRPSGILPMANASAWKVYEDLLSDRRVAFAIEPGGGSLQARWKAFAARGTASPKLWMDAYLAAFAMAGGHQLVTTDKAFKQFKGLHPIVLAGARTRP